MKTIFLSYSSRDKPFAVTLAKNLEAAGMYVWIDEAEIRVGESIIQKIAEAIESTDYVVAVLSRNSVSSRWVQHELSMAMDKAIAGKRVIVLPVLMEKCEVPSFLKGLLYADFTDLRRYQDSLSKLLKAIHQLEPPVMRGTGPPLLPCRFHGTVKVDHAPVMDGTIVAAEVGEDMYTTTTPAVYGASTYAIKIAPVSGVKYTKGAKITFTIGNRTAEQTGTWETGGNIKLHLTAPAYD